MSGGSAPDGVHRLAPNPGPVTGPGTDACLIGESEIAVIDGLIAHRRCTEQKVLRALAMHSLHAHLLKLQRQGLASVEAGCWLRAS